MTELSFLGQLRSRARRLRRNSTDAERVLWHELRGRRFKTAKFRRQQRVGPYILDFYCYDRKLCIELDGGGHSTPEKRGYDEERTRYLSGAGIRVIRFWNSDVLTKLDGVLASVNALLDPPHPVAFSDRPLPPGEGGPTLTSLQTKP